MEHKHQGRQAGGILLAGDPGIGKTTFVEMFGALIGMKSVVIEVPHISEEHIINIPFIVFNPQTNTSQSHNQQFQPVGNGANYKMVLAQSNLFAQVVAAKPMSDQEYLTYMKRAPKVIQDLFMAMGGTESEIPPAIQQARKNFTCILFLDEFYRQTSTRIRNILRGILNNRLGMHEIPDSIYIMYASNMKDTGLEEIPSNQQFQVVEYKAASKKEWFDWLVGKFQADQNVKLNMTVINKFKKLLADEDLSHTDVETAVRTSPRRWEQILLYVNAALPIPDGEHRTQHAQALLTNIKNNFINYDSLKDELPTTWSKLQEKVVDAVAELINETSAIDITSGDTLPDVEWRGPLMHAVEMATKLGKHRKHIPVVSGPPGIGKTTQAQAVADKFNLLLIEVDLGPLNSEDIIGLPLPGNGEKGESMAVRFSTPKLYHQIILQIEEAKEDYKKKLAKEYNAAQVAKQMQAFEQQKWKYLIFFDEINRVDEKTFNAMRRVILEKNFGPTDDEEHKDKEDNLLKLPEGSIVVAAMNAAGAGTTELTQHFRDVIDIIPAVGSWKSTRAWMFGREYIGIPDDIKNAAIQIIDQFVDKFKSRDDKHKPDQRPFYLDLGTEIYVSPREYVDMFSTLIRELNTRMKEVLADPDMDVNTMRNELDEAIGDAFEDSLNMPFYKQHFEKDEFLATLRKWVHNLDDQLFLGVISRKAKNVNSLESVLGDYLSGKNITAMAEDINVINANNSINNAQFIDGVKEAFMDRLVDDKSVKAIVLDEKYPKIVLKGNALATSGEKASHLTNFVLALLYSLHIHQYQNDRIMATGKAISQAFSERLKELSKSGKISEAVKDDFINATVQLRGDIQDVMTAL